MLFKAIILSIASSFLSLFSYLLITFFKRARNKKEQPIFGLMREAKLLSSICLIYLFVYSVIYFALMKNADILLNKFNFIAVPEAFGSVYGIAFYSFLSFLYLTFYYLIGRSISATLLEIIDKAPGGRLTLNEVKKIYAIEKKYQNELKGMLDGGFIVKEQDYYKNSFKGSLYAKMAHLIKRLLKL